MLSSEHSVAVVNGIQAIDYKHECLPVSPADVPTGEIEASSDLHLRFQPLTAELLAWKRVILPTALGLRKSQHTQRLDVS